MLLDNSALVRLWKCQILDALADTIPLHAPSQVLGEFRKQGPSERAALERLKVRGHPVTPTSRFWSDFSRLRADRYSTRDLGDDELLAVAATHAAEGVLFPLLTYDRGAAANAAREGLITLDFIDTLAWLVGCGRLSEEAADDVLVLARRLDGYQPPPGYPGNLSAIRVQRQQATIERTAAWHPAR